jgi:hypothetical protein
VLLRKVPPKLKDLGSFTIPCRIGDQTFEHAGVLKTDTRNSTNRYSVVV